jgi:hypothetical protein
MGPIRRGPIPISSVTISLPRVVPIRRSGTRITSVTLTRHADGNWWAACTLERRLRPPQRPDERAGDATVARGWGRKTAAAAGGRATESHGGRHEPAWARQLDPAQPTQVEHFSLPVAPYGQLTMNALTAADDAPIPAESGSADGMATLRRTIGRLQRHLNPGRS